MNSRHDAFGIGTTPQHQRPVDEHPTEPDRGGEVDRPHVADRVEHQGRREQHQGVQEDLTPGLPLAPDHRQHRHAGRRVVAREPHRQRPEVRRRPDEHDREQDPRRRRQGAGHRGPPDEGGHRAGRAADHDVLRRGALEPHRVDEDVEGDRGQGQGRRRARSRSRRGRRTRTRPARTRTPAPARGVTAWAGSGRCAGSPHDLVDVAVQVHVDALADPAASVPPDQRREDQPERGDAARRPGSSPARW